MSEFIPFHRELTKGEKRSLSRATRFIYLELALAARLTNGVLRLPRNPDVVDAVHDELGGNRREITEAMRELQRSFREGDDPMIRVEKHSDDSHDIVVVAWADWKLRDTNADRQRRLRERRKQEREQAQVTLPVTPVVTLQARDAITERHAPEKRRREERREDPPEGATRSRSTPKAKLERADQQVWRIFTAIYATARGRKYVRDASRDGHAAKAISSAADEHATDVSARETLLVFWCERYFAIEDDTWLENNGFPLHAMARALPRIGLPKEPLPTAAAEPPRDIVTDPTELARIKREAMDAIDVATRKRTPFLCDEPPEAIS